MFGGRNKSVEELFLKIDYLVEDDRTFDRIRLPKLENLTRLTDELIERQATLLKKKNDALLALEKCGIELNRMISVWDKTLEQKINESQDSRTKVGHIMLNEWKLRNAPPFKDDNIFKGLKDADARDHLFGMSDSFNLEFNMLLQESDNLRKLLRSLTSEFLIWFTGTYMRQMEMHLDPAKAEHQGRVRRYKNAKSSEDHGNANKKVRRSSSF